MPRFAFACLAGLALAFASPSFQAGHSWLATVGYGGVQTASCQGCGCRGGPGWRSHRTGQCVGWDRLARECGDPPSPARCTKEN